MEEVLAGQLLGGVHWLLADGAIIIAFRQLRLRSIRERLPEVASGGAICKERAELLLEGTQDGLARNDKIRFGGGKIEHENLSFSHYVIVEKVFSQYFTSAQKSVAVAPSSSRYGIRISTEQSTKPQTKLLFSASNVHETIATEQVNEIRLTRMFNSRTASINWKAMPCKHQTWT